MVNKSHKLTAKTRYEIECFIDALDLIPADLPYYPEYVVRGVLASESFHRCEITVEPSGIIRVTDIPTAVEFSRRNRTHHRRSAKQYCEDESIFDDSFFDPPFV